MRPCFEMMNLTQICINYYYYYFFFRETKFYNLYYTSYKRSKIIKMIQITYILIDITIKEKIWKNLSIPYHKIKSFPSVNTYLPPLQKSTLSNSTNQRNIIFVRTECQKYVSFPPSTH